MDTAAQAQDLLKRRSVIGTLITVDDNGNEVQHGVNQVIAFSSWGDKVWYSMVGVVDAPWSDICTLSSVVDFVESI